jgi:two-component system, OmpR family, response regulator
MAKRDKKVRIFSALEIANICGVVNQTAINWIKNGYLKAFTTPGGQYRVYSEDLLNFLSKRGMRIPDELQRIVTEEKKRSIIIIDDDEDLNNLLFEVLDEVFQNYKIIQAFDGFEAGMLVTEYKPQIIILDIDLPGVNGHDLCRKIKQDKTLTASKIISITALTDPAEETKIIQDGADAFLRKPLDFEQLSELIKTFLNGL